MKKRDLSELYQSEISQKDIDLIYWKRYFDQLTSPVTIDQVIPFEEQRQLYDIAKNLKGLYSEQQKDALFNQIMTNRGFTRFTSGTNRIIYTLPQYPTILFKIAYDIAGCDDSPREVINQELFKPYVPKVIEVNSLGNIAISEKVIAFSRLDQFSNCIGGPGGIYYIIRNVLIQGKYAVGDFGIKNWANWGYRDGFGPVLLDFPYVYEIDPHKVWCRNTTDKGTICNGKYRYDERFEKIVCSKCGATILPRQLCSSEYYNSGKVGKPQLVTNTNGDIIKSDVTNFTKMKIVFKRGEETVKTITNAQKINYFDFI